MLRRGAGEGIFFWKQTKVHTFRKTNKMHRDENLLKYRKAECVARRMSRCHDEKGEKKVTVLLE